MNTVLASQITIVVSVACIAINLHQFMQSYRQVQDQIEEFVEAVKQGEADESSLFWIHVVLYFVLPAAFLFVLLKAGIAYWVMGVLAIKCILAGWFIHWQQSRLIAGEIYLNFHHLLSKFDNFGNILIFVFILLGVFGV